MKKKYRMKKKFKIMLFLLILIISSISVACIYYVDGKSKPLPVLKKEPYYNIKKFEIKNDHLYMALNDTKEITYDLEIDSNYEEKMTFTTMDESIATVDSNGVVTSIKNGETSIQVKLKDEVKNVLITVTDLIYKPEDGYNTKKSKLVCNKYSEAENDLFDSILESRVNDAGYLTRAGAVAAARFLTLEFPYKIHYFSENGRLQTFNRTFIADAEGRYYHKGLYLHKSRFENINKDYIRYGPVVWGCDLYSYVNDFYGHNGFDCSGFISWVLVQAGFDPGDVGSGITDVKDMTDLGPKIPMKEALENDTIKVGDLLSGASITGGHIAILAGIKDGHYYVAESLWHTYKNGVLMEVYTKDNFEEYFKWVVDMKDFYKEDGNLTNYWT